MHSISLICAALAAAIHYYIFYLEYPAYGSARFCRTFGVSPTELATLRVPFRNLAIYNVMQAAGVSVGIMLSCILAAFAKIVNKIDIIAIFNFIKVLLFVLIIYFYTLNYNNKNLST